MNDMALPDTHNCGLTFTIVGKAISSVVFVKFADFPNEEQHGQITGRLYDRRS